MKKTLILCILLAMLCAFAVAEEAERETFVSGIFEYALLDDGTAEITRYIDEMSREELAIPSELDGYTVTAIGDGAFSFSDLTQVTIPDSVTTIGYEAFYYTSRMTDITIPNSVTAIGDRAFTDCHALTQVTIPDGVTDIGYGVFDSCDNLAQVTIPDSVTSIGDGAFYGCYNMTQITIPDGVTAIGNEAFSWCYGLEQITIPDGVTAIGDWTFSGCYGLEQITIPDGVTAIGDWAFSDCSGLTDVYYRGSEEEWSKISIGDENDGLDDATIHFNAVERWDFYTASDSEISDAMSNFWVGLDDATDATCFFFHDDEMRRGGYYWQCKQGSRTKGSFDVGELMYSENNAEISVVSADGEESALSVIPYEDGTIDVNFSSVSDIVSGYVRLYPDDFGLKETILDVILYRRDAKIN